MNWFLGLVLVSCLISFNLFAADMMIKLRVDVKDILRAVQQQPRAAATAATPVAAATKAATTVTKS